MPVIYSAGTTAATDTLYYNCSWVTNGATGSTITVSDPWYVSGSNVITQWWEYVNPPPALVAQSTAASLVARATVRDREADDVWHRWNGEYFEQVYNAAMTEDQQREWRLRNEQRMAAQRVAQDRAKELFLSWLTPEQRASFERESHFDVRSQSGRRYRIYAGERHGRHGNIHELDEAGTVLASICCAPSGDIPHFDAIVGQRVALEWDEAEFRRRANFTPRVPGYRRDAA